MSTRHLRSTSEPSTQPTHGSPNDGDLHHTPRKSPNRCEAGMHWYGGIDVRCQRLLWWQLSGIFPGQLPPRAPRRSSSSRACSSPRPKVRRRPQSPNSPPLTALLLSIHTSHTSLAGTSTCVLTAADGSGSTAKLGGITADADDANAAPVSGSLSCRNEVCCSAAHHRPHAALSANLILSLLPPTTTHSTTLSPHAHAAHG